MKRVGQDSPPVDPLLGGILHNTTGQQAAGLGLQNLFGPLEIANYYWETGPQGLTNTGSGLHLRPYDMARFGQLFLHGGSWEGRQLVPAGWVAASTRRHVRLGDQFGYGYQWWQRPVRDDLPPIAVGDDIAIAWGWGGQLIFVFPSLDMVVVSTAADYLSQYEGAVGFIQELLMTSVTDRAWPNGDVNGDGVVGGDDLSVMKQVVAESLPPGQAPCPVPARGDFNANGTLDFADCMTVQALLSGYAPSSPSPHPR